MNLNDERQTEDNSMTTKSNSLNSVDLEWLAFQYLTDELSEDGQVQFEDRLARDQLAREALARAVELTQAVAMVESSHTASNEAGVASAMVATQFVPQNRASSAWMTPVAWLSVAGLVCVAAVLYMIQPPSSVHPGSNPITKNGASTFVYSELASLWVETGDFLDTTSLVSEDEPTDGLLDDERPESPSEASLRGETDVDRLQAPSWMMAALTGSNNAEMQETRDEN